MRIGQSHLFEHCKLSPSLFSQNLAMRKDTNAAIAGIKQSPRV